MRILLFIGLLYSETIFSESLSSGCLDISAFGNSDSLFEYLGELSDESLKGDYNSTFCLVEYTRLEDWDIASTAASLLSKNLVAQPEVIFSFWGKGYLSDGMLGLAQGPMPDIIDYDYCELSTQVRTSVSKCVIEGACASSMLTLLNKMHEENLRYIPCPVE